MTLFLIAVSAIIGTGIGRTLCAALRASGVNL